MWYVLLGRTTRKAPHLAERAHLLHDMLDMLDICRTGEVSVSPILISLLSPVSRLALKRTPEFIIFTGPIG